MSNSLPGDNAPGVPRLASRLFFAIFPDQETAERIATLALNQRAALGMTGTLLAPERLHATLYFLGDYVELPQETIAKAHEAAQRVAVAPFEVAFDRCMSFPGRPGRQPFVLRGGAGVQELICLQRALASALHQVGLANRAKSKFTPHVTLLYDELRGRQRAVEPIRWQVHEFVLVHSVQAQAQAQAQAKYIPLARWPLQQAPPSADDLRYMSRAMELARMAEAAGEVPVGAVVVKDDRIIGEGWNRPIGTHDPTAHAEIIAIRQAAQAVGSYRLTDTTLYVTLEPCSMCAGAMVHSRVRRLVYAASDPQAGAAGSAFNIVQSDALNHRLQCTAGVMAEECTAQLREFFRARR